MASERVVIIGAVALSPKIACPSACSPTATFGFLGSHTLSSGWAGRIYHDPLRLKKRIFSLKMVQIRGHLQDKSGQGSD
jgi:hypothetical protein